MEAGAGGREFCVAIEVARYLKSPERNLAVLVHTVFQVNTRVRICAGKHETKPGILAMLICFGGFLEGAPGHEVRARSLAAGSNRIRHLVWLIAHCLPHHPLRPNRELFGDALYLD